MEDDGEVPVLKWLDSLQEKLLIKCFAKIERLAKLGHNLRRPECDFLRDGIYELRIGHSGNQHRILYFFHGRKAIVLSNAFLKKVKKVPDRQMRIALERKIKYERNPLMHTYKL
jgi:phage-related protein